MIGSDLLYDSVPRWYAMGDHLKRYSEWRETWVKLQRFVSLIKSGDLKM